MTYKIHHEGTEILIGLAAVLLVLNVPAWIFIRPLGFPIGLTVGSAIFFLLVVNFFRSPRRRFRGDSKNLVVASADGKVVAVEKVYEPEYLKREVMQISVFMSVFNVHANWYPVDGEVIMAKHHSGRFLAAYLPKSSTENERSTVVIRTPEGQDILVRQIAGAMARRIVTYAQPGEHVTIEEHMGFIKFGSRVDIYVPLNSDILVKLGETTTGGITPVARLHPEK
ncbi:MAG: phosphatidylserine decarboxylase family protein [Bacteroidales bacterium]|nr:phosphatidylserine decarboxylase family protein [Bacteroidales bacterium]